MYAQISLGESASETGLYLLIFFAGFFVATQRGGKILDERGARPAVVAGCLVAAVGFALWANEMPELSVGSQWPYMVLAGIGVGLVLSPANTDALNGCRAAATAKRRESRRLCATSAPASGWPCSARR